MKKLLLGGAFFATITVAIFGVISIGRNVAEHEREVILNILDYEYAIFSNSSYKDNTMKEYALGGVDIGWYQENYGQDVHILGDKIELGPEVEEELTRVAFIILLPERPTSKQWSKQKKVQIVMYKATDPQKLSTEVSAHALRYNGELYFMAFEGDVLKEEFHAVLCHEFFADILELATEYASWAKYEFSQRAGGNL